MWNMVLAPLNPKNMVFARTCFRGKKKIIRMLGLVKTGKSKSDCKIGSGAGQSPPDVALSRNKILGEILGHSAVDHALDHGKFEDCPEEELEVGKEGEQQLPLLAAQAVVEDSVKLGLLGVEMNGGNFILAEVVRVAGKFLRGHVGQHQKAAHGHLFELAVRLKYLDGFFQSAVLGEFQTADGVGRLIELNIGESVGEPGVCW